MTMAHNSTQRTLAWMLPVPLCFGAAHVLISFGWGARSVFLWTDMLIYLLIFAIAGTGWAMSGQEHLRDPWRQVKRSRMGMASLVVLAVYVSIAIVDSVHFRNALEQRSSAGEVQYASETLSLLDVALTSLRTRVEKTYSAPLAAHQFEKETIELAEGARARIYPRLEFGGAHLNAPDTELTSDATMTALRGAGLAFSLWLAGVFLLGVLLGQKGETWLGAMERLWLGQFDTPWRTILLTAGLIMLGIGVTVALAAKYHVLGTDKVGGDVLYQSIKSVRTGLVIGTLTTLIMLPFAVILGVAAGYFKGWIDDVIQYVYTTLNSIPGVLLIAAAVLVLQVYMSTHPELFETDVERADVRLFFLCAILGITSWTGLCRMLRGEALKLRELEYVQAARSFGLRHWQILLKHIIPNVMHIVLISVVLEFSGLVLAEAVLSYVGVGVDPSMHSWGNMINSARLEMAREPMVWWSLAAAFVFMFIMVLAANLFADVVRDAFDPRIRKQ